MWGTLGHWVGSPDLEKALLFGFWCSNSHAQNVQANGRFFLLARGSIFSKGALRAVGAIAFVVARRPEGPSCRGDSGGRLPPEKRITVLFDYSSEACDSGAGSTSYTSVTINIALRNT